MCKRYDDEQQELKFNPRLDRLRVRLGREGRLEPATRQAWPKAAMRIVISTPDTGRELTTMRWGVWPFYSPEKPVLVDNARDDKLLNSALWKKSVAKRRCLISGSAFYEYTGPAGGKWMVRFTLADRDGFWFAGLWDRDPNGLGAGYTMVTTRPNEMIAALPFDRMPVILGEDEADTWLGHEPLPDADLLALCAPFPAAAMARADQPKPERAAKKKITKADLGEITGELNLG